MNKFDDIINNAINNGSLGGANLTILQSGKKVVHAHYGTDGEDAIYRLYSMTKIFTAVVARKLIEKQQLSLTDQLSDYLPEYGNQLYFDEDGHINHSDKPITIEHLLNMTSGISYPSTGTYGKEKTKEHEEAIVALLKAGRTLSNRDIANSYGRVPRDFEPGEGWEYGANADILGSVLEIVSGKDLETLYQEELFEPLKMKDTHFFVPESETHRVSGVFTRDTKFELVVQHNRPLTKKPENGYLTLPLHNNIDVVAPLYVAGGGSAYSTADDYAVFGEMLRNNGRLDDVTILSGETVKDMVTPSLTEKQMAFKNKDEVGVTVPGYNYSNLMRILTNPGQAKVLGVNGTIGEFGWDGAGGNFIVIDPSRELVAVFMMQDNSGPEPILRRALYKALMSEFKVIH